MFRKSNNKPKQVRPDAIITQIRVMCAELKQFIKKAEQQIENGERIFTRGVNNQDKAQVNDAANKVALYERKKEGYSAIMDALEEIKQNSTEIGKLACDIFKYEDAFRIIVVSGSHLNIDSFKKFTQTITKDLFAQNASTLSDTTKLTDSFRHLLVDEGLTEQEIQKAIISLCERRNADVETVEQIIGTSLVRVVEDDSKPAIASYSGAIDISNVSDDLIPPVSTPVFERSLFPALQQAIKAIAF